MESWSSTACDRGRPREARATASPVEKPFLHSIRSCIKCTLLFFYFAAPPPSVLSPSHSPRKPEPPHFLHRSILRTHGATSVDPRCPPQGRSPSAADTHPLPWQTRQTRGLGTRPNASRFCGCSPNTSTSASSPLSPVPSQKTVNQSAVHALVRRKTLAALRTHCTARRPSLRTGWWGGCVGRSVSRGRSFRGRPPPAPR